VGERSLPAVSNGGTPFAFRAPENGLLLVYFGFTSCPDICPTTLADIRAAFEELEEEAERVELAMVTVDPARDTPEVLTGYVQSFVPNAHALRTEDDALLRDVALSFAAAYEVSTDTQGRIEVAHTARVFVVDDQGRIRVGWAFGTEPTDMASDIEILLSD
jgi:protein SCO1/2